MQKSTSLKKNLKKHPQSFSNSVAADTLASIGNLIWNDANQNGLQDVSEKGIAGIKVYLISVENSNSILTTSDKNGNYEFKNLSPGNYALVFNTPVGYEASPLNKGFDDTIDSDADELGGTTFITTLIAGENDISWDAGFYKTSIAPQPSSLKGIAWEDINANGQKESNDLAIAGIKVELLDGLKQAAKDLDGNPIISTTTNTSGNYQFLNLKAGNYFIKFTNPTGFQNTLQNQGNDATDSDINQETGLSAEIILAENSNTQTIDAGFYTTVIPPKASSLKGIVWEDMNANGQKESNDLAINGIKVELLDGLKQAAKDLNGNTINATYTVAGGNYEFINLKAGNYFVKFTNLTTYQTTLQNQGNDAADSDINQETSLSAEIILAENSNTQTIDAGFYQSASIGDFVWEDVNKNGIQESTEKGISGVKVYLIKVSTSNSVSVSTDLNGKYEFKNLIPGDYALVFNKPANHEVSPQNKGLDDKLNSDADEIGGTTFITSLESGENDTSWDAGFYKTVVAPKPSSLKGIAWEDMNGNGQKESNDFAINGIKVELLDGLKQAAKDLNGNTINATYTLAGGTYEFTNLKAGNYYIKFTSLTAYQTTLQNQGNDATDSDINQETGLSAEIILAENSNTQTIDAGFYQLASIGDFVWEDLNKNGIQESTEKGISGVKVYLIKVSSSNSVSVSTDLNGKYEFKNLIPGDYALVFNKPVSYEASSQNKGLDDKLNSDADEIGGTTYITSLESGENDTSWDAGFYKIVVPPKPSSLKGIAWEDMNANGQKESNDFAINGVKVELLDGLKEPAKDLNGNIINTTYTVAGGIYEFTNLKAGNYFVKFTNSTGFQATIQNQGNDATDSDINQETSLSAEIILAENSNTQTIDAGYFKPASIGDFVWEDLNGNGIQDLFDEKGIENMSIALNGTIFGNKLVEKTVFSNSIGQYIFQNLVPGNYKLTFTPSIGLANQGVNARRSENNQFVSQTIEFALVSGENNSTLDAGFFKLASVGDFVWEDKNKNGYQDVSEAGIKDVGISLKGITGKGKTVEKRISSDLQGKYEFDDIEPGTYTIHVEKPLGYKFTAKDFAINDNLDSDIDSLSFKSPAFTVSSGQINTSIDAGLYKTAQIDGYVWNDKNENGIQEADELPISNIAVNILGNSGDSRAFVKSTSTDKDGKYIFYQIDPGFYNLNFVRPANFKTSPKDSGNDDTKDSDLLNESISDIIIESGFNQKYDAGFYKPTEYGSIRGLVFNDLNKNGLNDDNSFVYQSQVILLDALGNKIAETKTDFNGKYVFEKLIGAKYQIQFVAAFNKKFTGSNLGLIDAVDSDAASNGKTGIITIDTTKPINDSARDIQFIDAGIIPLDLTCQPICVPFFINKNSTKK